jgi:Holliday junction resolvasome RuvABC DNA-binding subunit
VTVWNNQQVASKLREMADLLEQQGANPFRVGAYRRAARTIVAREEELAVLWRREGIEGLVRLPEIGTSIALAIDEMLGRGRWMQLERLRGALDPEKLFRAIPGVGPSMARRIHDELHVDTLEALEMAAHDGRLATVPGIGPRRVAIIAAALAQMLQRRPLRRRAGDDEPAVAALLDVDREYRAKAAAGRLRKIAPRRFNPEGVAWLSILHAERENWRFTALFSNTARAHELGKTDDWVIIYFHSDAGPEGQRTVVTETRGPLEGQRVVRGREGECADYYEAAGIPA